MSWLERAPRITAVAFGAALLLGCELLFRGLDVGDFRDRPDPFAGFSRFRPTFVAEPPGPGPTRYVAIDGDAPTRHWVADKPANGFRVFVFGGSTEAGTPYGYEFAFAALLERQLAAALPDRTVEVINCAVPGYASRRLLYLAEEVARFSPDLFVISTGHNELIEQRVYAHLFAVPPWLFELRQSLRRLRITVLLEDLVGFAREETRPEIDTRKVYVPMFGTRLDSDLWKDEERDPEQQRFYALAMFRNNVDRMIHLAREADARVLLLSQTKNYADWPVTGSAHRADLRPDELDAWRQSMTRADAARQAGDAAAETAALERALSIDPHYAITHQRLADLQRAAGRYDAAAESYRLAHNLTLDNFGTTPARNEVVSALARERDTLWLDIEGVFARASPDGLVGDELFADFLHPNLSGHQLMADAIFATLRDAGFPESADAWREPPPHSEPDTIFAVRPDLRAGELRMRILAELLSNRPERAADRLAELRHYTDDAAGLAQIEEWIENGLPDTIAPKHK